MSTFFKSICKIIKTNKLNWKPKSLSIPALLGIRLLQTVSWKFQFLRSAKPKIFYQLQWPDAWWGQPFVNQYFQQTTFKFIKKNPDLICLKTCMQVWLYSIYCLWFNDEATLGVKFLHLCSLHWLSVWTVHHVCSLDLEEKWMKTLSDVVEYHTYCLDWNVINMGVHLPWEMYLIDLFY